MSIRVGCPSCKKSFENLPSLNNHISKTKCNSGKKLEFEDLLKFAKLRYKVFVVSA